MKDTITLVRYIKEALKGLEVKDNA